MNQFHVPKKAWLLIALLLSLAAYVIAHQYVTAPLLRPVVLELLLVLTVIIAVHLLERIFLWRTIQAFLVDAVSVAVKNATELVKAADQCGLIAIYPDRKSAGDDIKQAIDQAKKRIWLLGIAFSQVVTIDKLLANLADMPKDKRPELRVLLLDALRSPALFRSFLESPLPLVKTILDFDRDQSLVRDPICITNLYDQCQHASNLFDLNESFRDCVKFYAHSPNCWMAIVDDTCFYEPYSFGRPPKAPAHLGLGMYFPVFKFSKQIEPRTFDILEDHFQKLWMTTDLQQLGFGARLEDTRRLTKEILDQRQSWFRRVFEALDRSAVNKEEQRHSPRSPCESYPEVIVSLTWISGNTSHSNKATIIDFSSEGLGVRVEKRDELPPIGSTVVLVSLPSDTVLNNYSLHLLNYFKGRPLETVRTAPDTMFVGLKICATKPAAVDDEAVVPCGPGSVPTAANVPTE